ncbi:MAG: hypothetical protein AB7K52_06555 [Phycisphaerales bacterium]
MREFVKNTISQVVQGVHEAQVATNASGAFVYPRSQVYWSSKSGKPEYDGTGAAHPVPIEFDLAVTVTESSDMSGAAGVSVAWVNIGGGGMTAQSNQVISRLRFTIPIVPPMG